MTSKKHEYEFPSFSSRLQKADDKFRDKNINKLLKQAAEWNVEGLDEIIKELLNLKNEGYYKKLHDAYKIRNKICASDAILNNKEVLNVRLLRLAFENLSYPTINLPPLTSLIDSKSAACTYTFLECIYYINVSRILEHEDIEQIYFSSLDERVAFALDKFDTVNSMPEPTAEYFMKIKKLKWKNKKKQKNLQKIGKCKNRYRRFYIRITTHKFPRNRTSFSNVSFWLQRSK